MSTTVAVLGPGGIGGSLAVTLALSGARVVCVARPETALAIAREGLTLDRPGETLHVRPEAVARLEHEVDLLLVTVKAPALGDALERIAPETVATGLVLPLLNGLEHVERIRDRLGQRVAAGSIGRIETYRQDATTLVQLTAPAPVVSIAADTLHADDLGVAFTALRGAGVEVTQNESERHVLWEKVVRLAPLAALTSLTQRPLGDLRADPELRARLRAAIDEACAAAAAEDVVIAPEAQWEMIDGMPAALTTSTARDVAAGRPSEVDAIVGGVVRAARRRGVSTPTLERLLADLEGV